MVLDKLPEAVIIHLFKEWMIDEPGKSTETRQEDIPQNIVTNSWD